MVLRRGVLHLPVDVNAVIDPITAATLLEGLPALSKVSPEEMLALTTIVSEVKAVSGTNIFAEADPPAFHLLISGSLSIASAEDDSVVSAGPGDVVGLYQMLSGKPLLHRGHCLEDTRALRVQHDDLLDLLMQRPDLQRQLLGSLFRGSHFPS